MGLRSTPSAMQHAVLLGRDSWMSLTNRSYRSLPPRPSYHRSFWLCGVLSPNPARLVQANQLDHLPPQGVKFDFTPAMEVVVGEILAELAAPPILVFPDWDAVADGSRPFHVYCDACIDGFGAALEQE